MTIAEHELTVQKRTVLIFDVCSSSNMLEDLLLSENIQAMRNLIISIKTFLRGKQSEGRCEIYKFIGDGWILLFPYQVRGTELIAFMEELSQTFAKKLKKLVIPHLQLIPEVLGLSFGVDRGKLVRMTMMERTEFIGRPLNIASRLQSVIKDKDHNPAYKALFSKYCFTALRIPKGYRGAKVVRRQLRNIQGGQNYSCVKLTLRT
jgi:class 3 adenylate cyclase